MIFGIFSINKKVNTFIILIEFVSGENSSEDVLNIFMISTVLCASYIYEIFKIS